MAEVEFGHATQVRVGENVGIKDPERGIGTDPGSIGSDGSCRAEQLVFMDHANAHGRADFCSRCCSIVCAVSMQVDEDIGDAGTGAELEPDIEQRLARIGTRHLGTESVRGRKRVPCPPASKKAFNVGPRDHDAGLESQTDAVSDCRAEMSIASRRARRGR